MLPLQLKDPSRHFPLTATQYTITQEAIALHLKNNNDDGKY